jgi:hypothetical protein
MASPSQVKPYIKAAIKELIKQRTPQVSTHE